MRRVLGSLLILVATTTMATAAEPASRLAVEGTEFVLYRADGRVLRSVELLGAALDLGGGRQLRIDAVRSDPADASGLILLHRFSQRAGNGAWTDVCSADREGRREGFPVPGRWVDGRYRHEPTHFALTCTGGAQAKCVRWGYRPWDRAADGSALTDLYEACVHMVRADYCGDGTATTRDGMAIDIYDRHGIQKPEGGDDYRFEAGWAPTGAVCVNHVRVPDNATLEAIAARCPRLAHALGARCDESAAISAGAVLFNRSR